MKIRQPRLVITLGPLAVATLLATTPTQAAAIDEEAKAQGPQGAVCVRLPGSKCGKQKQTK